MEKCRIVGSHFELVPAEELPKKRIIQIYEQKAFYTGDGVRAFLCEVDDDEDFQFKRPDKII